MGNRGGSPPVSSDTTTVKQTVQPITFKALANTTVLTSNGNSSGKGISTLSSTSTLYQEKINPTFFSSTTNIALVAGGAFGIIVVLILCLLLITRNYCKRTKPTNSNESARQMVSSGAHDEGVAPGAVQIQIDVTNIGDADDMYDFDGTDQNQPGVCASDDDTVQYQTIPGAQRADQTGSEIVYAIPKVIDRMPTSSSETIGRVVYANTPRVQGI